MSRAGEHKKDNFPYDFFCKNNIMLFLPEINHRKIIGVMKYLVGGKLLTFEFSMSRTGEDKKGNFPYNFFCKNNFMLFLPEINHRKIIDVVKY